MSDKNGFKNGSWIWVHGLEKAKDLNGKLGQIIDFNKEKQRFEVFIPNIDLKIEPLSKALVDNLRICISISKVILKTPQDDDQIRKLFHQKDEPSMAGMKLIKPDNLKVYKGQLIECQYISTGQPFGPFESQWYPREHPMFLVKDDGNSPVLKRCGFPLVVVRFPYNRKIHPRKHYDNQFATYMLIDAHSGFAPKEWQSYVGPILVYRPLQASKAGNKIQHFNSADLGIIWDFMCNVLDRYGDGPGAVQPDRDFTPQNLKDYTANYHLSEDVARTNIPHKSQSQLEFQ